MDQDFDSKFVTDADVWVHGDEFAPVTRRDPEPSAQRSWGGIARKALMAGLAIAATMTIVHPAPAHADGIDGYFGRMVFGNDHPELTQADRDRMSQMGYGNNVKAYESDVNVAKGARAAALGDKLGRSHQWQNKQTGNSGAFQVVGDYYRGRTVNFVTGQTEVCRTMASTYAINGTIHSVTIEACQDRQNGPWIFHNN